MTKGLMSKDVVEVTEVTGKAQNQDINVLVSPASSQLCDAKLAFPLTRPKLSNLQK